MELFAERLHQRNTARLVLAHGSGPPYSVTGQWLELRPWIRMHHHLAPREDTRYPGDIRRITRFICGEAVGLVACGGGAFSAAHIGVFEALSDAGLELDVIGGTSGGAAMGAALALGVAPSEIELRTHQIFVERKAMRRWTWPRYSLLDHTELDRSLSEHFTAVDIEDLERPFFAVSTNLSRNVAHCIDRGPLWQAIRASAAIPALLPPVFTADGEMLVDGSLVENVPLRTMMAMKSGPNIVIDFHTENADRCTIDSSTLPARGELVMRMLTLRGKAILPSVPGPQSVLLRSLMLNRPDYTADLGVADILLRPTIPAGIGHLDWHRHAELRYAAREYAARELERLRSEGHVLMQVACDP
jgi:NTE family protein